MIGFLVSDFGNKGLTEMNRTRLTNDFTEKVNDKLGLRGSALLVAYVCNLLLENGNIRKTS